MAEDYYVRNLLEQFYNVLENLARCAKVLRSLHLNITIGIIIIIVTVIVMTMIIILKELFVKTHVARWINTTSR